MEREPTWSEFRSYAGIGGLVVWLMGLLLSAPEYLIYCCQAAFVLLLALVWWDIRRTERL